MDHGEAKEHGNDISAAPVRYRTAATEPVRTRWTPKPEQILILESIFNSGMVNPPKDETVRIRKLLERFGAVVDANVFYWFQNRRSRSRRRMRQLQSGLMIDRSGVTSAAGDAVALHEQSISCNSSCLSSTPSGHDSVDGRGGGGGTGGGFFPCSSSACFMGDADDGDLFTISCQMGIMQSSQSPFVCSSEFSQLPYQAGIITVFINGIAAEVPSGPVDLRSVFGPNVTLMHSSGQLLPVNEYGILLQNLQNGESYFLVSALNGG